MLDNKIETADLLEIYGNLLTETQKEIMYDYYFNDISISEIAENRNITRQAVKDAIDKSNKQLVEIEKSVKMLNIKKEIYAVIDTLVMEKKISRKSGRKITSILEG